MKRDEWLAEFRRLAKERDSARSEWDRLMQIGRIMNGTPTDRSLDDERRADAAWERATEADAAFVKLARSGPPKL